MASDVGARKEYLSKFDTDTWKKIKKYQEKNPVDDDGRKMSVNKVINKSVKQFLK